MSGDSTPTAALRMCPKCGTPRGAPCSWPTWFHAERWDTEPEGTAGPDLFETYSYWVKWDTATRSFLIRW